MKNYYFISDAHLGCRAFEHRRTKERRLVNFLDAIKEKAEAVFMLGDIFDFWFEYKNVVPKGFTRVLGKICELTDRGVEVHFFQGNHDMWCEDYLEKECGVILHKSTCTIELCGKVFYLAHGHKLDKVDDNWKTRFMFTCFESRTLKKIAKWIHPRWFISFGYRWAESSRKKHFAPKPFLGEDKEGLVLFAKDYLKTHPDINYFLFGHRHIEVDIYLEEDEKARRREDEKAYRRDNEDVLASMKRSCRLMILGNWYDLFTYAVFDGEDLFMERYVEGETEV
jgi:UDP-2,3-diacylglucosamine hydrolase